MERINALKITEKESLDIHLHAFLSNYQLYNKTEILDIPNNQAYQEILSLRDMRSEVTTFAQSIYSTKINPYVESVIDFFIKIDPSYTDNKEYLIELLSEFTIEITSSSMNGMTKQKRIDFNQILLSDYHRLGILRYKNEVYLYIYIIIKEQSKLLRSTTHGDLSRRSSLLDSEPNPYNEGIFKNYAYKRKSFVHETNIYLKRLCHKFIKGAKNPVINVKYRIPNNFKEKVEQSYYEIVQGDIVTLCYVPRKTADYFEVLIVLNEKIKENYNPIQEYIYEISNRIDSSENISKSTSFTNSFENEETFEEMMKCIGNNTFLIKKVVLDKFYIYELNNTIIQYMNDHHLDITLQIKPEITRIYVKNYH